MGRLEGKVAIVTGGASGMGRSIALLFLREGARVVIADIDEAKAAGVVAESGGALTFVRTDVTSEEDVVRLVRETVALHGRLDVMVNNAGGGIGYTLEMSVGEWDDCFALNARSAFLGIKHAVPEMRKAGGGSIISTSSDAGIRAIPAVHAYAASKAAVIKLSESAAQEVGIDNIRVNVIAPGWIGTPMLIGGLTGGDEGAAERVLRQAQPIRRPGAPADIANAALFLASDESSFVTGVTIPVDGGWLVQAIQRPEVEQELAALRDDQPEWLEQR